MIERFLRSPFTMAVMLLGAACAYGVSIYTEESTQSLLYKSTIILFIAFYFVYFVLLYFFNKKNPKRKIPYLTYRPYEFKEEDEGHQYITFRACRNVYIYYYFAIPAALILAAIFKDWAIAPFIIIVFLGIGQYLVYWLEIRKLHS
ncbi:hypothetical protein [Metabacillus arenae]|uniref:Uncharacterized protein n=1 Tax=Metabacillus arenae TaxID=2771434 RepID=A0A926S1X9_9BACI|nr:hypothetical protein [Metabacillus arenae]MBD1381424.1 hypothetical protein [Metabacillus arenae]